MEGKKKRERTVEIINSFQALHNFNFTEHFLHSSLTNNLSFEKYLAP